MDYLFSLSIWIMDVNIWIPNAIHNMERIDRLVYIHIYESTTN
jgi:hypothetical protein